jgi:Protein of unknown function (DUF3118).
MSKFKHFLITRFNVPLFKKTNVVISEEYLDKRFYLFEKYCFPSVKEQTDKNFTWLVFFDSRTPQKYKNHCISLKEECKQFIPIFVDYDEMTRQSLHQEIELDKFKVYGQKQTNLKDIGMNYEVDAFLSYFNKVIHSLCNGDESHILTSRLDNDDAINKEYIATLNKQPIATLNNSFISMKYGCEVDDRKDFGIEYDMVDNHFLAFAEKYSENLQTVFAIQHDKILQSKYKTIVLETSVPMWCEVIHGGNVGNVMFIYRKKRYVKNSNILEPLFSIRRQYNIISFMYSYLLTIPRYYIHQKLENISWVHNAIMITKKKLGII